MNPSRPNQPEQVTEQDLLALHLNELSPVRTEAVRHALAEDPMLAAESASIAATLAAVTLSSAAANRNPIVLDDATLDRNWQALRPGLRPHTPVPSRWRFPALGGGLLAATAAGIVFLVHTHRSVPADLAQAKWPSEIADRNQTPPTLQSPLLTLTPNDQTEAHPKVPDFHPRFSSGVYYPKSRKPESAVHPIGLAPRPLPSSALSSSEPLRQPSITLLPNPGITPEVHIPFAAENKSAQAQADLSQKTPVGNAGKRLSGAPRRSHPIDVMLGVGGTFLLKRDSVTDTTSIHTVSATHAIVAIGSLHQQFRSALGYRVTLSYSRPDFNYSYSFLNAGTRYSEGSGVNSRIFEVAGTYVIQGPHHKRLSTSADAGAALLAFLPDTSQAPQTNSNLRAAGIAGVNFDYAITEHIGARLGYRAKIFRSPGFNYTGIDLPLSTPIIVDNEPSLGVTYTFGKK